jgi:selenide,water dikinase
MAVTGLVHPSKVITNAGAKPGDKLVLTKPLGTGFVTTAHKLNDCPDETFRRAIESMIQLNAVGKAAVDEIGGVHAMTDVTGFGLAGHTFEMAEGSGTTIALDLGKLPLIPGVEKLAGVKSFRTRASKTNAEYVAEGLKLEGKVDPIRLEVFYDAQTSGGLLISIEAAKADALVAALNRHNAAASAIIGEVLPRGEALLIVRP